MIENGFSTNDVNLGNMRVVHFSTGHAGGAGLAARRLNEALNQFGVSSSFYALKRKSYNPSANEFEISRSIFRRLYSVVFLSIQKNFSKKMFFSTFSSNAKSFRYFKNFQNTPGTILHFHNWTNLISERNLLKLMARQSNIVLTAHDERIITGGCHYKFDCLLFSSGCKKCPLVNFPIEKLLIQLSKKRKDQYLKSNPPKAWLVSPSNWIQKEIDSANVFEAKKNVKIQNTLGPNWNHQNYSRAKKTDDASLTIGIASMSTSSFVKAGDVVSSILNSPSIKNNGFDFLFLNQIPESQHFENFWMKIDCLLALTRADNSPNVIWEALSLDIPVISVNLGGIPEIGTPGEIVLLNKAEDAVSFLEDTSAKGAKFFIINADISAAKSQGYPVENHKNLYLKIMSQALTGDSKF